MGERTCSMRECKGKYYCRGLCQSHYEKARRRDELPPLQTQMTLTESHRLTNIDRQNATADCSVCGQGVPVRVSNGRGCECITKRKNDKLAWRRTRDQRLRRKYGISKQQYEEMFRAQTGRCLICADSPGLLHVDHCHTTGRVRGLLCRNCNVALGHLRDNPEYAIAAADYLRTR